MHNGLAEFVQEELCLQNTIQSERTTTVITDNQTEGVRVANKPHHICRKMNLSQTDNCQAHTCKGGTKHLQ